MTGTYKDVGYIYAYQEDMQRQGFRFFETITDHTYPKEFLPFIPKEPITGWKWRKAIKKYIATYSKWFEGYKVEIVKANGYWNDLHNFQYEIWVKDL